MQRRKFVSNMAMGAGVGAIASTVAVAATPSKTWEDPQRLSDEEVASMMVKVVEFVEAEMAKRHANVWNGEEMNRLYREITDGLTEAGFAYRDNGICIRFMSDGRVAFRAMNHDVAPVTVSAAKWKSYQELRATEAKFLDSSGNMSELTVTLEGVVRLMMFGRDGVAADITCKSLSEVSRVTDVDKNIVSDILVEFIDHPVKEEELQLKKRWLHVKDGGCFAVNAESKDSTFNFKHVTLKCYRLDKDQLGHDVVDMVRAGDAEVRKAWLAMLS